MTPKGLFGELTGLADLLDRSLPSRALRFPIRPVTLPDDKTEYSFILFGIMVEIIPRVEAMDLDPYDGVEGLTVDVRDGVMSLMLNRPNDLNALTPAILLGIPVLLAKAACDPHVKLLVLSGAGRAFSSGADLGGAQAEVTGSTASAITPASVMRAVTEAIRGIVDFPHPVVALVRGPAVGLGASLALACDVILTSKSAYFLLGFTKIGLMPDGGASALVPASIGRVRAMRMTLLAERISAEDALDWGLVTAVYPDEAFSSEAERIVAQLAAGSVRALQKTKAAVNAATLEQLPAALELEGRGQDELLRSEDFAKSVAAFQSRSAP